MLAGSGGRITSEQLRIYLHDNSASNGALVNQRANYELALAAQDLGYTVKYKPHGKFIVLEELDDSFDESFDWSVFGKYAPIENR